MAITPMHLELRVRIDVKVRYSIFDLSGSLPFEIYYVFARPWPTPKERLRHPGPLTSEYVDRPLTIRVKDSIFDISCALKYGYIKIFDQGQINTPIDFSDIDLNMPREPQHITLVSGAGNVNRWSQRLYEISTKIDPFSSIGRKLRPHRRYRLVVSEDSELPVREFILEGKGDDEPPRQGPSETLRLNIELKRSAPEEFTVLPSLRQPPQITVKLSTTSNKLETPNGGDFHLKIEITNRSDRAIIAKSRGHQDYLAPSKRHKPPTDQRPRITSLHAGNLDSDIDWSNLSIRKVPIGEEMIDEYVQACTVPVGPTNKASRIYRSGFTTLEPNVTLIREDRLARIYPESVEFEPGRYHLTLFPLGAVWFWGSLHDVFGDSDSIDKYPWPPSQTPPVMFASDDVIEFSIAG